jgi:hypothetical protein
MVSDAFLKHERHVLAESIKLRNLQERQAKIDQDDVFSNFSDQLEAPKELIHRPRKSR